MKNVIPNTDFQFEMFNGCNAILKHASISLGEMHLKIENELVSYLLLLGDTNYIDCYCKMNNINFRIAGGDETKMLYNKVFGNQNIILPNIIHLIIDCNEGQCNILTGIIVLQENPSEIPYIDFAQPIWKNGISINDL